MSTDSSSDRDPVERLAEEFLDRRRRGEHATIDDYAEQYPDWAERIRELFPALEMMERLKPGSGDRTGSFDGDAGGDGGGHPERLGDYRILREVGRGGMGVVYEAVQESLGRHVALKVLPLHGRVDPVQMERFRLEARSAAKLHHTHIVPVHGVGEHEGVHYYAMQFIQGCGLDAVLNDLRRLRPDAGAAPGPEAAATEPAAALSRAVAESLLAGGGAGTRTGEGSGDAPAISSGDGSALSGHAEPGYHRSVARIGVQVAEALAHAHGQGVLHRDIKPSNLLLDADGEAWVTDFGLAKLVGSDGPTRTKDVVGTVRYMAPERFEGGSDPRSDVYGLGVTLYELLTLHPAFTAGTQARLIERVLHSAPTAPRKLDPRIPRDLETVVLKAMAKEPAARYATAGALAADLGNYLTGKPILARRVGLPERAWRWCRRNPAAAGLMGASGIAAMLLVGLVVGLIFYSELKRAHDSETAIRYFNNMLMAEREWTNCNVGRTEQLLDECVPKPKQPDLRNWEWHYLKRQCHTEIRTLIGPQKEFYNLAFSRDGRRVAAIASGSASIPIWNAETGELLRPFMAGPDWENSYGGIAFSPDGELIASSRGRHFDLGQVKIWNVATGGELHEFPKGNFPRVNGASSSVAFSPDGTRLAVAGGEMMDGSLLTVWDVKSGENLLPKHAMEGEMGWVSVAFSPDGNSLALARGIFDEARTDRQSGEVTILDSRSGDEVMPPLKGHKGPLTSVAYSPDGKHLASTGYDLMVRIWDAKTGTEASAFRVASLRPLRVVFSPDSRRVATASDDNSARIWDAETGQELLTFRGHTHEVTGVAFRGDGKRLATSSADQTVKIWDAETGKEALTLQGHSAWVNGVAFRPPDGRQVVTACIDKKVRLFDVADGQLRRTFDDQFGSVWGVTFSPDGTLIASASGEWTDPKPLGQVTIRNAATGEIIHTLRGHAGLVRRAVFSPDGRRLATAGGEHGFEAGVVKVWDVKTGQEILPPLRGHTTGLNALAYSPDGRFLASGGWDNTVRLWDANTGVEISRFEGLLNVVWEVAFNRDGTHIASACEDASVRIWEVKTTKQVLQFNGHKGSVRCLAYSPDGTRIASGGLDETVKVWDPTNGQEALTLHGHTGPIWEVAFSPDGHRIASASEDGTVRIWDGTPWVEPTARTVQGLQKHESH